MAAVPTIALTHHQIIELAAPFARRGHHVDLAASDRLQRRLVFKPVASTDAAGAGPASVQTLQLDNAEDAARSRARYRLTRLQALPCGLQASLLAEGSDPAALLQRIESVPPQRQWLQGSGSGSTTPIGLHQRVDAGTAGTAGTAGGAARLVLLRAEAQIAGLTLTLRVPAVSGIPAVVELQSAPDRSFDLPEDLLAVLGWPWTRLERTRLGWRGHLRLRRNEPQRSLDAEARLQQAAAHLARTLAAPPARFHEEHRAARWRVSLRRAVPLLVCIALVAGAASLPRLGLASNSVLMMLIFNAPPLLLLLFFSMSEMPRIEIPPLPRRGRASTWLAHDSKR